MTCVYCLDGGCEVCKPKISVAEVVDLMRSSRSEQEWNQNCDLVKRSFSGYPEWWYQEIIMSGLATKASKNW